MREACRIAAAVLDELVASVRPGMNTYDLDQMGKRLIQSMGAQSACFDYRAGSRAFPAHTCLSVNEEVVHGIGSLHRVLAEADIITVDVCVCYQGFIGDNARTVAVGETDERSQYLLEHTEQALSAGIEKAVAGNRVGEISHAIERYLTRHGLGIVRDFVGHGVGRTMHEPPQIPNFGSRKRGDRLKPGMTLAIEPMVTLGGAKVKIAEDGWTAYTADGSRAAHFEHTVLITNESPEILTQANKRV